MSALTLMTAKCALHVVSAFRRHASMTGALYFDSKLGGGSLGEGSKLENSQF